MKILGIFLMGFGFANTINAEGLAIGLWVLEIMSAFLLAIFEDF